MAQWVKPTSQMGALVQFPSSLFPAQLPIHAPEKVAKIGQVLYSLLATWEMRMESQIPGFSVIQPWLLSFGKWTTKWKLITSFASSPCHSAIQISKSFLEEQRFPQAFLKSESKLKALFLSMIFSLGYKYRV